MLTGVTIGNGLDWSPDRTLCYFVDSPLRRVDVFDYDVSTGELTGFAGGLERKEHLLELEAGASGRPQGQARLPLLLAHAI